MREYIEKLINNKIPLNSGYSYIRTERIAIPVHRVTLGISKRMTTNLDIVEEMVLRFISIGIDDIETIANILGLQRDILDITIGDLHVKNLAFHSSGRCLLMAKGKDAIRNLSVSKREKDILRDVFVNAVTGEIFGEKNRDYTEGYVLDATKVKHSINASSIELYRRNMSELAIIFEQSAKTYLSDDLKITDELVSIDTVDDLCTGFIIVPIHIYVTEGGLDIDIVAQNRWQRGIIDEHRGIIIEQMRAKKLLPNLIHSSNGVVSSPNLQNNASSEDQYKHLKSLLSITDDNIFSKEAQEFIFKPRRLFENELFDFCELVFSGASSIEMQVDDVIYWSKNSMFLTIGSFVSKKCDCRVLYQRSSDDITRVIRRIIGSCPNIDKKSIIKAEHTCHFRIVVDLKICIDVNHELMNVFFSDQCFPKTVVHISDARINHIETN